MFAQRLVVRCATVFLLLLLTAVFVFPQSNKNKQARPAVQTPPEQARKAKAEPNNAFERWIKEDVSLIITPDERQAFEKLKTDEEREQFINLFWRQRDPDPDTEENEYREQYYERIAYANEHFSSGMPGWKTDRGRIYIKFGKPDEIESHPSGGSYQPASFAGYGSTTTYPFETWFYRFLPGVGSGVEIEFVDPTGSGEYRIARDANEKNALAHLSGSGRTPNDPGPDYHRENSPYSIERQANLQKAPEIERRIGDIIGGPTVDDNPLNADVRVDFFKLSDSRVVAAFTVQTANSELVFKDSGGLQTARLNILGRIVNVTDERVGAFEDSVTTSATIAELTEAKERISAYSKAIVLAPGRYRADVIVRDVASGATGIRKLGFQVPRYADGKLAISSMVLAAKLESLQGKLAMGQFVIGQTKVIPNIAGVYHRGQPAGVYLELYNAGIDQTTLRPAVDVEYALSKDGKELQKQVEDWHGISDSGERLILARLIDTRGLTPGDYELTIRIHDRVSGQTLAPAAKFTLAR